MSLSPAEVKQLGAIMLLALVARVAYLFVFQSWILPTEETFQFGWEMGRVAMALAEGHGFAFPMNPPQPTAWVAPIYTALMAGVFTRLGVFSVESALALFAIQIVISTATVVVVYLLGRRIYDGATGLIAALGFALYPPAIYFAAGRIWSGALFSLLLCTALLLVLAVGERSRPRLAFATGLLLGVTALVDAMVLIAIPAIAGWVLWQHRQRRILALVPALALLIGAWMAIAPWTARNHSAFDRFVPIKSNFGHTLFIGNNDRVTPRDHFYALPGSLKSGPEIDDRTRPIEWEEWGEPPPGMTPADLNRMHALDEARWNHVFLNETIRWIERNPIRFAQLTAARFAAYWTVIHLELSASAMASLVAYLAVLGLAILGFVRTWRSSPVVLVATVIAMLPVTYYVTWVGMFKYRYPIEPLLLIIAAHALSRYGPIRRLLPPSSSGSAPPAASV